MSCLQGGPYISDDVRALFFIKCNTYLTRRISEYWLWWWAQSFASLFLVPGQPLNFKAEPESETSILLSWTPPRSDTIASYELVYRDGDQGEEVRVINLSFVGKIYMKRGPWPKQPKWVFGAFEDGSQKKKKTIVIDKMLFDLVFQARYYSIIRSQQNKAYMR